MFLKKKKNSEGIQVLNACQFSFATFPYECKLVKFEADPLLLHYSWGKMAGYAFSLGLTCNTPERLWKDLLHLLKFLKV